MTSQRQQSTFCRVCEPACGLMATLEGRQIVSLKPDKSHPVTKGFACHKGVNFLKIHQDPDRLDYPLQRAVSDKFQPSSFTAVDWNTAASGIAGKIQQITERHGQQALAAYIGNPNAFNALGTESIQRFFRQVGCENLFGAATLDCANKFAGSEAVYGSSLIHPVPDIEHTDCLIIFGENPRVSHMSFINIPDPMGKIRDACKRGATVLYINPRHVESASPQTGEVLQILPDTDLYLMAALLNEIDALGRFHNNLIARHGHRIDELRQFIASYSAETVAPIVGVPATQIKILADRFSAAPRASVHMSTGANMGRQGTLCYWLLQMLSFVTGNLDRQGGNYYSQGFYPAVKAGRTQLNDDVFFSSIHGELRKVRGELPTTLLPEMILQEEDPIRVLFVVAGNPLLSAAGEDRFREALKKLDLLVVIDLFRNATAEYADYILPATDMLEREDVNLAGLGVQFQPYVQYTDALVAPKAERKPEWWIAAKIAQAMGLPSLLDKVNPDLYGRLNGMLRCSELSIEQLKQLPSHTAVLGGHRYGEFFTNVIQTDTGRVDCCPAFFDKALERAHRIFAELRDEPPKYRLINLRNNYMHNSWYQNVASLKRGKHVDNPLHISPEDAALAGLIDGDSVELSSQYGKIVARIVADDSLRSGVVAMTHGWGNQRTPGLRVARQYPGTNINAILPSGPESFEALSNQAFMTGVPVNIYPLSA